MIRSAAVLAALVVAAHALTGAVGCTPALEPLDIEDGCQPLLAGADCMLPFPSDYFLVDDDEMPSGKRVQMTDAAKLITDDGYSADMNDYRASDGASRMPFIAALLGSAVSAQGTVDIFADYGSSTKKDSRTLILDAATGEAIPHFVDLDPRAEDPARRALVLHPQLQLAERTRYVVVLQGLVGEDGEAAAVPEGYRRLRDDVVGEDARLKPLVAVYADVVWPALSKAGVARAETQLAWTFTTGSDEHVMKDMLRARELVLAELAATPPSVVVEAIFENEANPAIWRLIRGTVTGPMVMAAPVPPTVLSRDDDGRVKLNGTTTFEFTALIPVSVRDSYAPGTLLEYGHGFFGSQGELEGGATPDVMNGAHAVGVAIDWAGMSVDDIGTVVGDAGEQVWQTLRFGDRVVQGMANWLTVTEALKGPLLDATDPNGVAAFHRPTEPGMLGVVVDPENASATNAGALVWDVGRVDFMGISQGHILGGVHVALNPDVQRVILNVGGAAFTQMMWRAVPFDRFIFLFDFSLSDPLDQQKLTTTMQQQFDSFDPATYARFVLRDELPVGPSSNPQDRRVLIQTGVGDTQVPNVSSYLHARLLEIPVVAESAVKPWGLQAEAAPIDGSAISIYDVGFDDAFYAVAEPQDEETAVHNGVRELPGAQLQMRTFLEDGVVVDPCEGGGPCTFTLP